MADSSDEDSSSDVDGGRYYLGGGLGFATFEATLSCWAYETLLLYIFMNITRLDIHEMSSSL